MPTIVGRDPAFVRRTTCFSCAAIIEYTLAETREAKVNWDYLGDYDIACVINCPGVPQNPNRMAGTGCIGFAWTTDRIDEGEWKYLGCSPASADFVSERALYLGPCVRPSEYETLKSALAQILDIVESERNRAADWIALADSYGGPESPQRTEYVASVCTAERIAAAIQAAMKSTKL